MFMADERSSNSSLHTVDSNGSVSDNPAPPKENPLFKWYAVMTQPGMERKAISVLEERIKKFKLSDHFGRIVIPSQQKEKLDSQGKKKFFDQKMMPGYIFVHMHMTDHSYTVVKETPKISSFLGASNLTRTPPPMSDDEVDRVLNRAAHVAQEIAAKPKMMFERGERVKVIDGPFTNFVGDVDEVKPDKSKLKLLISVFGRPTPVEIEFTKVEKVTT